MPDVGSMSFLLKFPGNKIFRIGVYDLLGVTVDAIVNPANSGLSHGGGLAANIAEEAGPKLEEQCRQYVREKGRVPVTGAMVTTAGELSYKGVIHAVGPRMGDGDELGKIERTILNCLKAAEQRKWKSIAFPAISTGLFMVPSAICAKAFEKAVPAYFNNNPASSIDLVWLCLTINHFKDFDTVLKK